MSVDLGAVFRAGAGEAEGFAGLGQVFVPLRFFQRHGFADGGLVNLDDFDAGFFQVQYFVV